MGRNRSGSTARGGGAAAGTGSRGPNGGQVYESGGLYFEREKLDVGKADREVVLLDVAKLDQAWQRDGRSYIDSQGNGQIGNRRERFREFVSQGGGTRETPIELPRVVVRQTSQGPQITFRNGRHRFSVLRDRGLTKIPVVIDKADGGVRIAKRELQ